MSNEAETWEQLIRAAYLRYREGSRSTKSDRAAKLFGALTAWQHIAQFAREQADEQVRETMMEIMTGDIDK